MSERATVIEPSTACALTTLSTRCAPGGPTGMTMIPLGLSCCSSGGGTWSMPQVTMILSNVSGTGSAATAGVAAATGAAAGEGVATGEGVAAGAGSAAEAVVSTQP